jgi:undecaprenyl-diphosphatase
MTILQSILLGIIQGLTEFIPVSSSGHLVLVPYLLNWHIPAQDAFIFDILVQVATLAAVFAYFWKDLVSMVAGFFKALLQGKPFSSPEARQGWLILLATVPAGLFGLLIKDAVEQAFSSPQATALFLLVTAGLLLIAERLGKRQRSLDTLTWVDALWIGIAQALAVFPGISRSGSTMTGGMLRGLERPSAARFSFLLSIPIMLAAGLLASLDLLSASKLGALLPAFIPGFIAAAITGYLAIGWLLEFLKKRPLLVFAAYCLALSLITLAVSLFRS